MSTIQTLSAELAGQPEISRLDRAHYVREAHRLRAEQFDRLFAAVRRSLFGPGRSANRPVPPSHATTVPAN